MSKDKDYKKTIGFWVLVFLAGGIAGVLFNQLLVPWLAGFSPFNKIDWLANLHDGVTIVNKTERVYISQDAAYQETISRLGNSVVAIRAERHYRLNGKKQVPLATPEVLAEGSGFILTGDGLIATAGVLVPFETTRVIIIRDGKETEAQIVKKDGQNNLALLKIGDTNLPVVGLGDTTAIDLGQMLFLIGIDNSTKSFNKLVNVGFVRTLAPELTLTFNESQLANGSPLINIRGEVVGLNLVDKNGVIKVITTDKLRELLE
jgi:S1-C subfamily serine protease